MVHSTTLQTEARLRPNPGCAVSQEGGNAYVLLVQQYFFARTSMDTFSKILTEITRNL